MRGKGNTRYIFRVRNGLPLANTFYQGKQKEMNMDSWLEKQELKQAMNTYQYKPQSSK